MFLFQGVTFDDNIALVYKIWMDHFRNKLEEAMKMPNCLFE